MTSNLLCAFDTAIYIRAMKEEQYFLVASNAKVILYLKF